MKLLETFIYGFLCEQKFSFLLDKYLGVELLGYLKFMYHYIWNCQTVFQSGCTT